ncbi:hypothetical protein CUJ88_48030 (plasmid) [Paraburkholderia hospita]|jgi:hypothetical protein|nr:hypothetical protein CUJ88_48030 [Paraburkholderia hospita]
MRISGRDCMSIIAFSGHHFVRAVRHDCTQSLLRFASISLIAGGGRGYNAQMIGYRYWPKVGFDAELFDGETASAPHLVTCRTVQDIVALDTAWGSANGSQRLMEFDLRADSPGWQKLLDYLHEKEFI